MKNFNFKSIIISTIIISLSVFTSCKTNEVEITSDLTYPQMLQRGQDAVANENYKLADKYFISCIDIYGADLKCYVEARYELATSFLKQKKIQMAKTMFTEILSIYDRPDALYLIQPKFKKLSSIQLEKIAAAEKAEQDRLDKIEQKKAKQAKPANSAESEN